MRVGIGSRLLPARANQTAHHFSIVAICLLTLILFWPSLKTAFSLAFRDDRYLQIILAPLVCSFLIFWRRAKIFLMARYSPRQGIPLLLISMLLGIVSVYGGSGRESARLRLAIVATLLVWLSAFLFCYGLQSLRAALYPLFCLFLMFPLPPAWMDRVAAILQNGSASASYAILHISGIPVFRREMLFSLPGFDFEVGPECSGIRSSLALMMVAIIAGYVYLQSPWARSALMLLTIPIALFKNAIRIAVISVLGAYVDRVFVDGPFHHKYGGLVFSVLGAVLFVLVLAGLQRIEKWIRGSPPLEQLTNSIQST
jgi:exosortase